MITEDLLKQKLTVVNIGIEHFADSLRKQDVKTIQVRWRPPAIGGKDIGKIIENVQLLSSKANSKVMDHFLSSDPAWVGIKSAFDAVPGMKKNTILHSGPPIQWDKMCTVQKRAVIGGILHEGLANAEDEAIRLIKDGNIDLRSALDLNVAGAGVGIATSSMMVNIVQDRSTGTEGFCCPFEGRTGLATWGIYNKEIEQRLKLVEKRVGPAMDEILQKLEGIELRSKITQGLQMNDEFHTRQHAGGLLLFNEITPALIKAGLEKELLSDCVDFVRTERFFHSLAMASAISILRRIKDVEYSTVVTTMAGNGVKFGIKVGFAGDKWFTADSPEITGKYLSAKWKAEDAQPWIGDSSVMETIGLGGFAAAASPTVVQLRGGSIEDSVRQTEEMRAICLESNRNYPIPMLGFTGPPVGIDICKVVETGITPICHGGILSKDGGQIGAGSSRIPFEIFKKAFQSLVTRYDLSIGGLK